MTYTDYESLAKILLQFYSQEFDFKEWNLPHHPDSIRIPDELVLFYKMQNYIPALFKKDTSFTKYNELHATNNKVTIKKQGDKYWYIQTNNAQSDTSVYVCDKEECTLTCDSLSDYLIVELAILILEQMPIIAQCKVVDGTIKQVRKYLKNLRIFANFPYSIFLSPDNEVISIKYYEDVVYMRFGGKKPDILNKLTTECNIDLLYSNDKIVKSTSLPDIVETKHQKEFLQDDIFGKLTIDGNETLEGSLPVLLHYKNVSITINNDDDAENKTLLLKILKIAKKRISLITANFDLKLRNEISKEITNEAYSQSDDQAEQNTIDKLTNDLVLSSLVFYASDTLMVFKSPLIFKDQDIQVQLDSKLSIEDISIE